MNTRTLGHLSVRGLLLVSGLSTIALGAPIDMEIDPALSSLDLEITVDITIASDTDTNSSTLSGNLEMEFDDLGNPTSISLIDMAIMIDQPMNYDWSFGFLGSADAVLSDGSVLYANPGTTVGPVPVNAGSFAFPEVLINLGGQLIVDYDIFVVGSGSELLELGALGSVGSAFSGSVIVDGETITVTSVLPFDATQALFDPNGNEIGTVTTVGTATIVAVGTNPVCPADLTGDGALNFFDVSAFLNAYASENPVADFNNDGAFNFFDVSTFLAAFTAGCP